MTNHTQTEAVHLDHALHGTDLDSLARESFDPDKIIQETLDGVSDEQLRKLAIRMIQVFDDMKYQVERKAIRANVRNQIHKIGKTEFTKDEVNDLLIDYEIFDAVKKLGGATANYETFTRLITYEDMNFLAKLLNNPRFDKWFLSQAHIYGLVGTAAFGAKLREDVYKIFTEDMPMEARVIVLLMILMPLIYGTYMKFTQIRLKKIREMLQESRTTKSDERTDYVHKCLRYLVHLQREYKADQDNQENLQAKIELVRRMVRKVINGEEDLIKPEEYGGKLQITGHTVLKSIETDF